MRNKLGQFIKGLIPWNKGKEDFRPSPETEFKKGEDHYGPNHPSWKGGVQTTKRDGVYIWVNGKRVRQARLIWEQRNGEIPQGYVIYHKDGDKMNDDISNLEVISRAELLKRNRWR